MNTKFFALLRLTLLALPLVFDPLRGLLTSSDRSDYYSHIALIPFVSAYLIYRKRGALFSTEKSRNEETKKEVRSRNQGRRFRSASQS